MKGIKSILINTEENSPKINQRFSSAASRSRVYFLNKEILRLEEELNTQEIISKRNLNKEFKNDKEKEKELRIYEKYLDGVVYCIGNIDSRIGKFFSRG